MRPNRAALLFFQYRLHTCTFVEQVDQFPVTSSIFIRHSSIEPISRPGMIVVKYSAKNNGLTIPLCSDERNAPADVTTHRCFFHSRCREAKRILLPRRRHTAHRRYLLPFRYAKPTTNGLTVFLSHGSGNFQARAHLQNLCARQSHQSPKTVRKIGRERIEILNSLYRGCRAIKKTLLTPYCNERFRHSSLSSGNKSGMITPSTPDLFASSRNLSIPYRRIGFTYPIKTTGMSDFRRASFTDSNTFRIVGRSESQCGMNAGSLLRLR